MVRGQESPRSEERFPFMLPQRNRTGQPGYCTLLLVPSLSLDAVACRHLPVPCPSPFFFSCNVPPARRLSWFTYTPTFPREHQKCELLAQRQGRGVKRKRQQRTVRARLAFTGFLQPMLIPGCPFFGNRKDLMRHITGPLRLLAAHIRIDQAIKLRPRPVKPGSVHDSKGPHHAAVYLCSSTTYNHPPAADPRFNKQATASTRSVHRSYISVYPSSVLKGPRSRLWALAAITLSTTAPQPPHHNHRTTTTAPQPQPQSRPRRTSNLDLALQARHPRLIRISSLQCRSTSRGSCPLQALTADQNKVPDLGLGPPASVTDLGTETATSGKMAVATQCAHSFVMLKSDNTLLQWTCHLCHSGPHWWIFECRYCQLHTCRACMQTA
ncbi:hypothetical protein VTK56DRAFT_7635 [Thermocarpiscus australiensis]